MPLLWACLVLHDCSDLMKHSAEATLSLKAALLGFMVESLGQWPYMRWLRSRLRSWPDGKVCDKDYSVAGWGMLYLFSIT